MKKIIIIIMVLTIFLLVGCSKLPDDVKELKESTKGMSKRDKVELICRYENQIYIDQCPDEGNCHCESSNCKECKPDSVICESECENKKCWNKTEYREKLIKDCNVVIEEPIDCNKYSILCWFGYDGFRGGDINYKGRTGYYIGRCDLAGNRCVYLAENMEHYMI